MYISDNSIAFHDEIPSLLTLMARDREVKSEFSILINVYPLDTYSFANIYDDEYVYEASTKTWRAKMQNIPYQPATKKVGALTAYQFGFGDAGYASKIYAFPSALRNIMIELNIGSCISCGFPSNTTQKTYDAASAHITKETEEILQGFTLLQ